MFVFVCIYFGRVDIGRFILRRLKKNIKGVFPAFLTCDHIAYIIWDSDNTKKSRMLCGRLFPILDVQRCKNEFIKEKHVAILFNRIEGGKEHQKQNVCKGRPI